MTAIKTIDNLIITDFLKLVECVRLLGAECFIVGISPNLALQIVNNKFDRWKVRTFSTLQKGVEFAIGLNGFNLVKK